MTFLQFPRSTRSLSTVKVNSLVNLRIFSKRTLSFATSERELVPLITDIDFGNLN